MAKIKFDKYKRGHDEHEQRIDETPGPKRKVATTKNSKRGWGGWGEKFQDKEDEEITLLTEIDIETDYFHE